MKNRFLQATIRFLKETHLYNLNDEIQKKEIKHIVELCKQQNYSAIIRRLYNTSGAFIFNYKKKITQFEEFLFMYLFNKTPTEILDEYLKNNGLYGLFYKTIKELDRTMDLTHGVVETINYSFCWSATEEGHNFWCKEDDKFKKYIYNIIFENIK